MGKRNYLVDGLSGVGKPSVYEELIRRGYKAISTDLVPTVPGPSMPTLTPASQSDSLVTIPGCGISKRLSADSKARNQRCCSSVGAVATFTASCPTSPRCSTSESMTTRCVAASKRGQTPTGRLAKRELKPCSDSIGAARRRSGPSMWTRPSLFTRSSTTCFAGPIVDACSKRLVGPLRKCAHSSGALFGLSPGETFPGRLPRDV